ncbi:MAG: hypothetical protein IPK21_13795 [Haliscomenobacter sp.]|nr:hypothetical protein [Haliscomenobacter sp.]
MGRGGGEAVDIEVMRLPDGKPYIPASSIAGCLRSFTAGVEGYFWGKTGRNQKTGNSEQNPLQSHIRFDDLIPNTLHTTENITMRDGVKIDHKKGIAEDKKNMTIRSWSQDCLSFSGRNHASRQYKRSGNRCCFGY